MTLALSHVPGSPMPHPANLPYVPTLPLNVCHMGSLPTTVHLLSRMRYQISETCRPQESEAQPSFAAGRRARTHTKVAANTNRCSEMYGTRLSMCYSAKATSRNQKMETEGCPSPTRWVGLGTQNNKSSPQKYTPCLQCGLCVLKTNHLALNAQEM